MKVQTEKNITSEMAQVHSNIALDAERQTACVQNTSKKDVVYTGVQRGGGRMPETTGIRKAQTGQKQALWGSDVCFDLGGTGFWVCGSGCVH